MKKQLLIAAFCLAALNANAQTAWPTTETIAKQAYLVDVNTGAVLLDKNGEQRMPTSSMSKIMTAYATYEALKSGQITMDTAFPVSERAWRMQGSKMFVAVGDSVKVGELIQGVIVQSGNDACVVLAEGIAGSEEVFARKITELAKKLGAKDTNFTNATGWPDPNHYSTPQDLALLATHLINDYPQHYHYDSQIDYTYNNIKQGNRNPLLYNTQGADGIKTGHTDVGGYGLIGSVKRDGRRLILVVNGLGSMQERADESHRLIEWGFSQFRDVTVAQAGVALDALPVWYGEGEKVNVTVTEDVAMTLPYGTEPTAKITAQTPLAAPVHKGQEVGILTVSVTGQADRTFKLVATDDVAALGFFGRLEKNLGM